MRVIPLVLTVGALLGACGGGDSSSPAASAPATSATGPAAATAADAGGEVVDVRIGAFFQYEPDPVEVPIGTTVRWTNPDAILHTATSGEPGAQTDVFDGEMDGAGTTFEFTFEEPGTYPYFCTVHGAAMTGEVVVG